MRTHIKSSSCSRHHHQTRRRTHTPRHQPSSHHHHRVCVCVCDYAVRVRVCVAAPRVAARSRAVVSAIIIRHDNILYTLQVFDINTHTHTISRHPPSLRACSQNYRHTHTCGAHRTHPSMNATTVVHRTQDNGGDFGGVDAGGRKG